MTADFLFNVGNYLIFLMAILAGGPPALYAAGIAASLDLVNIYLIIILSTFVYTIADIFYYLIGFYSRNLFIEKIFSYLKIRKKTIKNLEHRLKRNFLKTIILVKIIFPITVPGLIIAGTSKIPLKKYLFLIIIINAIIVLIATLLGYYSGFILLAFAKYSKIGAWSFLAVFLVIIFILLLIRFLPKKLEKHQILKNQFSLTL